METQQKLPGQLSSQVQKYAEADAQRAYDSDIFVSPGAFSLLKNNAFLQLVRTQFYSANFSYTNYIRLANIRNV